MRANHYGKFVLTYRQERPRSNPRLAGSAQFPALELMIDLHVYVSQDTATRASYVVEMISITLIVHLEQS